MIEQSYPGEHEDLKGLVISLAPIAIWILLLIGILGS
jgi:hypothetical protein